MVRRWAEIVELVHELGRPAILQANIRNDLAVRSAAGRPPGVGAEDVAQPFLRMRVVSVRLGQMIQLARHYREAGAMRRRVAVLPGNAGAP